MVLGALVAGEVSGEDLVEAEVEGEEDLVGGEVGEVATLISVQETGLARIQGRGEICELFSCPVDSSIGDLVTD